MQCATCRVKCTFFEHANTRTEHNAERQHSNRQLSHLRQNTTVLLLPQNASSWWTEHPQNTSILT